MTASRHRREPSARTLAVGAILALAFGLGVLLLGTADGAWLRAGLVLSLTLAVGAGILAMDQARLTQARTEVVLSRERTEQARAAAELVERLMAAERRITQLETDLSALRRDRQSGSRTVVVVASNRPQLVLPLVQRAFASDADTTDGGHADERLASFVSEGLDHLHTPDAPPAEPDRVIELPEETFVPSATMPVSRPSAVAGPPPEVVREISLEGLVLFARPAGMPESFPSAASEPPSDATEPSSATPTDASDTVPAERIIDLDARRDTRTRTA